MQKSVVLWKEILYLGGARVPSVPKHRIPQKPALEMVLTTVVTEGPAFLMRCQEAA